MHTGFISQGIMPWILSLNTPGTKVYGTIYEYSIARFTNTVLTVMLYYCELIVLRAIVMQTQIQCDSCFNQFTIFHVDMKFIIIIIIWLYISLKL